LFFCILFSLVNCLTKSLIPAGKEHSNCNFWLNIFTAARDECAEMKIEVQSLIFQFRDRSLCGWRLEAIKGFAKKKDLSLYLSLSPNLPYFPSPFLFRDLFKLQACRCQLVLILSCRLPSAFLYLSLLFSPSLSLTLTPSLLSLYVPLIY